MPDNMGNIWGLSRLMGEVEQPTNTQSMQNPQFGGSPEQLMGMLQSPHVQQMLQQWGINFNPQQVRQSPFLPNSFMQGHPQLGGALSGAMANVAATPEAPLVSGAGSGMTRAMQGMAGGPEMQRQFQIRQMLAPMQMMGQQMPAAEFQRKQQLLDLLGRWEQDRAHQGEESLDIQRQKADQETMRGGPKFNQVTGETYMPHPGIPGHPTQMGQGQMGGGMPSESYGISPGIISPQQQYQPAGYSKEQASTGRIADVSTAKSAGPQKIAETNVQGRKDVATTNVQGKKDVANIQGGTARDVANIRGSTARDTANIRAGAQLAKIKGESPTAYAKFSQQYNQAEQQHQKIVQRAQELLAAQQIDQAGHDSMVQAADQELATAKANIDQARGKPGESALGALKPGAPQANAQPQGSGQARRPGGTGGPQGQASVPAQQQQPQQQTDPSNPAFWSQPQ